MLAEIQRDLPNVPLEVSEKWLLPIATRPRLGWPPTDQNEWRYVLGKGFSLDHLRALSWRKTEIELKPDLFLKRDMNIIIGLFQTHVLKQATIFSVSMSDGAERFRNCCTFLKEHGVFPWPVVLEDSKNEYRVMDGSHRLCAFFYLYGYFNVQNEEVPCLKVKGNQTAWVAS